MVGCREPESRFEERLDDGDIRSLLALIALHSVPPESSVTQLSGGQQKRLAMLRALVRGADLLVLDEPTSGLDPKTSAAVVEMLARELDREPRALLLITHDYKTAVRLCSRVVALADGRIEEVPLTGSSTHDATLLHEALSDDDVVPKTNAQRPQPRGVVPLILGFVTMGAPLAAMSLALLGAMLVAQSAASASCARSARATACSIARGVTTARGSG